MVVSVVILGQKLGIQMYNIIILAVLPTYLWLEGS